MSKKPKLYNIISYKHNTIVSYKRNCMFEKDYAILLLSHLPESLSGTVIKKLNSLQHYDISEFNLNKSQYYYLNSFSYLFNEKGKWKKFKPAEFYLPQDTGKVLIKSPSRGCIIRKAVLLSFVKEEESKEKGERRNTKKNLHALKVILTKKFSEMN